MIVRLTIGALALAIIAIILSLAVLNGFKNEVTAKQRGFFGDIWITKQSLNYSPESSPFSLKTEEIKKIKKEANVSHIAPIATKSAIMKVNEEVEGVLLKGIDETYDQGYVKDVLIEGELLDFSKENIDEQLIVSKYTANRLNLSLGDTFIMYFVQENIKPRRFYVSGIYSTGSEDLDQTYVLGSLNLIRKLNQLTEGETGAYELRIKNFQEIEETTHRVNNTLPLEFSAVSIVEQMPEIFNWLNMLDINDSIIFVLMSVVAVINMISALLISILERAPMIGTLKALGMTNRNIRRVFIYNSAYLIGSGLLIGNVVSIAFYIFQNTTRFFKLDPQIYFINYVPLQIGWQEVFALNILLIVIAVFSLLIPSMLITRISPIKTIQFK
ncbi:MAG TPA: FtsX-like permease family protein [Sphingobacterium sp.]|nr:FtsX-like permease family protein [Sphingobacterium sp.]